MTLDIKHLTEDTGELSLTDFTFLTRVGVLIKSSSVFKISKSNVGSVFVNLFFGICRIWQGISFNSFVSKRVKDNLYNSSLELLT